MPSRRVWLTVELLAPAILQLMVPLTAGSGGQLCYHLLDIAIAVDTTSSDTAADFQQLASEVKNIASKFRIGQTMTRLALISIAQSAQVVANFADVNSLSDFNAAVDRLKSSSGEASITSGMSTARLSVLNHARGPELAKVLLILVKDGRSENSREPTKAELSGIEAESAAVRALGVAIHAVAPGGPWIQTVLNALFGQNHLLFKDQQKAMSSIKSLRNLACPDCQGKSERAGLCLSGWKKVLMLSKSMIMASHGADRCQTLMDQRIEKCVAVKQRSCNTFDRSVGKCEADNTVQILSFWQYLNRKTQACETHNATVRASCDEAARCPNQASEVIILLDKSISITSNFEKELEVAKSLINTLNISPVLVRVGLFIFHDQVVKIASLGDFLSRESLKSEIDKIATRYPKFGGTNTHLALDKAKEMFHSDSRPGVDKSLILITDGLSNYPDRTFASTASIKEIGVTIFAIGIGITESHAAELRTMTSPESDTNLLLMSNFNDLKRWTERFFSRVCLQLSQPNPKLCEEKVTLQSMSHCMSVTKQQMLTEIQYKFDKEKKCLKEMKTAMLDRCKTVCTDPYNGMQYLEGENWTNDCSEFTCSSASKDVLMLMSRKKCQAADKSCREIGSPPFKCIDDQGNGADNCECVAQDGRAVLKFVI